MFLESLEKVYHKSTIHKNLIMNFALVPNAHLAKLHTVISSEPSFFVQLGIVFVLGHVCHHTFPSAHGLHVNMNYPQRVRHHR